MLDSNGAASMNGMEGGPRVTVVSAVAEDTVPALFAAATHDGTGISAALAKVRASALALAATPPLGVRAPEIGPATPLLAEHATLHVAVEGLSLLAARAVQDSRLPSVTLAPELAAALGVVEPVDASPVVREKVRTATDALLRAYQTLADRGAERIAARDRITATAALPSARGLALGLLPSATRTAVYLSTDARSLASHCAKLLAHPLPEAVAAGRALLAASRGAAPELFSSVLPSKMRASAPAEMARAIARLYAPPQEGSSATMVISQPVRLVRYDKDALERIVLALAYEGSEPAVHAFALTGSLRFAKEPALVEVLRGLLRERAPGERLPRGFEASTMTFELMLDAATACELRSHEGLAISAQRVTCKLGFQTPEDLIDLGLGEGYQDAMLAAQAAWADIEAMDPLASEYAVPLGYRVRSLWTVDLRQLVEIVESQSAKERPTRVRRIAHGLFRTASGVLPWLRDIARVDLD